MLEDIDYQKLAKVVSFWVKSCLYLERASVLYRAGNKQQKAKLEESVCKLKKNRDLCWKTLCLSAPPNFVEVLKNNMGTVESTGVDNGKNTNT